MDPLRLHITREEDGVRISGAPEGDVHVRGEGLRAAPEAAFALGLLPALRTGRSLEIDAAISPRLADRLPDLARTLRCFGEFFDVPLEPVEVRAPTRAPDPGEPGRGVGCFFSGGLDSFYSVLTERERLTHVVFVHGLDIPLDAHALRAQASVAAREVAEELGLELVELETDVRQMLDPHLRWDYAYGAALCALSHLLSETLRTVLIPASDHLRLLVPWGSHPALDPLFGTEALDIVHHAADRDRVGKAEVVGASPLAMRLLRVCWRNPDGAYNCGECEKCVRTMVDLRAAGHDGACRTLPPVDLAEVAARRDFYHSYRGPQIAAAQVRGDADLVAALLASEARVGDDPVALRAEIDRLQRALAAVESSRSYRLLRPVRNLRARARRSRHPAI